MAQETATSELLMRSLQNLQREVRLIKDSMATKSQMDDVTARLDAFFRREEAHYNELSYLRQDHDEPVLRVQGIEERQS